MGKHRRQRAYRLTLAPARSQLDALSRHADAARWAYNHALGLKNDAQRRWRLIVDELVTLGWTEKAAQREAGRMVKVPSKPAVQKRWNRLKGDDCTGEPGICSWWRTVSTYAFQSAWIDADRAWQNWMDSITGKRAGRRVGLPKFKKKYRSRDSFRLYGAIRLDTYRRLRLPNLGSIRLHDSGKRLHRALVRGGEIKAVTVSRGGHRWYASVLVDEPDITPGRETQHGPSQTQRARGDVGVDLGVHHLAALSNKDNLDLSNKDTVDNPRHLRKARARLVKVQRELSRRQGPDKRTGKQASNGWNKARARLSRLQHHIAEQRAAHLHQITKRLVTRYARVAIEDLHVAGMTRSARGSADKPGRNVRAKAGLNRSILDAAPGEFRRQLEYKASWYSSAVVLCDRWAPTSKTCSACGAAKTKLSLATRVFGCDGCGAVLDRDVNAARNILAAALPVASDSGETLNAHGGPVRPMPPRAASARAVETGRPGRSARSPRGSNRPGTLPKTG